MAENEKEIDKIRKSHCLNEQTDEASAKIFHEPVCPNSIATQELQPQIQSTKYSKKPDDIQQENEEIKRNVNHDTDVEQNSIIANNTFQMRLKVLNMEYNILKTYYVKQLIDNEKHTWTSIQNIVLKINNFENDESELLKAENLSTELMRKIKNVLAIKAAKNKDMQKPERNIELPNYRSIVTVRGTKEDVKNCILQAKVALGNGDYNKANNLLLKAERILPTENARDLLKQVQMAMELKQNPKLNEKAIKTVDHGYTVTREEITSEFNSVNAIKYLSTPENAFTAGNLVKVKQTLRKSKRLNPSLNVKKNMYHVKASEDRLYSSEIKLLDGSNFEPAKVLGNISRENREQSRYSFKHKADSKIVKTTPKNQVEDYIIKLENTNNPKILEKPLNFPNTAENPKPIPLGKEQLEVVNNSLLLEKNSYLICKEFPSEGNESNKTEALKCIKIAEVAFKKGEYDRSERLLLKSLRILDSQGAKANLKLVRDAKTQNKTNAIIKTETKYNEHFNQHSLNQETKEYNKCIQRISKALAERNLTRAEHFLTKAIRIHYNDYNQKQHEHIQHLLQPLNDKVITLKIIKSENNLKREKEAKILAHLANHAKNEKNFWIARYYMELAFEKQPNEETEKQLRNLKAEIERQNRQHSCSENDKKFEANKLLDKVSLYIYVDDIDKAEFFLIISWDLSKCRRTIMIYKRFLKARIAKHGREKKNERDGRNYRNISESDKLVMLALDKYEKKQTEEVKVILKAASELHSSILIDKLLDEVFTNKKDNVQGTDKYCSIKG